MDLLGPVTQVAERPVWRLGPAAEPALVLGPTQRQQLSGPLSKWAGVSHPNEENAKRPTGCGARFLIVGGARCNLYSSPLEGYLNVPHPRGPWRFHQRGRTLKFVSLLPTLRHLTVLQTKLCQRELLFACSLGALSVMPSVCWTGVVS